MPIKKYNTPEEAKEARRSSARNWARAHVAEIAAYDKKRYDANREQVLAFKKARRAANKDAINARKRSARAAEKAARLAA